MMIQVTDYINVKQRALELGCNVPTGLALLPRNFDSAASKKELIHESVVPTLRVLFRQDEIVESKIEKSGETIPYIVQKAFEWVGPIIFVSASLLSQNPNAVSVALGVTSNYLTDFFKGIPGKKEISLDIVVETEENKTYKRVHYRGDPEGLKDLPDVLREVR